jgi:hypothetical protein
LAAHAETAQVSWTTQADADGNGILSPDELYPILVNLSGANAISVTMSHCVAFANIFDKDRNGYITRSGRCCCSSPSITRTLT